MTARAQTKSPRAETITSFGGENLVGFRIVHSFVAKGVKVKTKRPRTLAEANKWLLANAAKVDAHAKASTNRLIGRNSV